MGDLTGVMSEETKIASPILAAKDLNVTTQLAHIVSALKRYGISIAYQKRDFVRRPLEAHCA